MYLVQNVDYLIMVQVRSNNSSRFFRYADKTISKIKKEAEDYLAVKDVDRI